MEDRYFVKLVRPTGEPIFVKYIPCVLGSENALVVKLQTLKEDSSKSSLNVRLNEDKIKALHATSINTHHVKHKLVIATCKSISPTHAILNYDFDTESFRLQALEPLQLNDVTLTAASGVVPVRSSDRLHFFCDRCYAPHFFIVMLPQSTKAETIDSVPNVWRNRTGKQSVF